MFTSFKRQIKRTIKSRDLRIFTRHFSSRAHAANIYLIGNHPVIILSIYLICNFDLIKIILFITP